MMMIQNNRKLQEKIYFQVKLNFFGTTNGTPNYLQKKLER